MIGSDGADTGGWADVRRRVEHESSSLRLVGAVVPFTFLFIMPTNHRLLAPDRDLSSSETGELLVRWGRLHAVRTLLSLAGAMVYLWLMLTTGSPIQRPLVASNFGV